MRIPSTAMKMNPVMAKTRTDRLRIDSAGGEAGSKIDVLWARRITAVAPFFPRRLRQPAEQVHSSRSPPGNAGKRSCVLVRWSVISRPARGESPPLLGGGFFPVSAKLESHGGQQSVLEIRLAARREALIEGRGKDGHGYRLVDGGLDCPPPLARVREPARESRELLICGQGGRRQVEQP